MPIKHSLYVATFTEREVEVPDNCPACGADLTEMGALTEANWQDCTVSSHLEPGPVNPHVEPEGQTDYGDTYYPVGLVCQNCQEDLPPSEATALYWRKKRIAKAAAKAKRRGRP